MRNFTGAILCTLTLLSAVPAYGQARAVNTHGQCLAQPGDRVELDDVVELHRQLQAAGQSTASAKSPYETQADYEARLRTMRQPTRVVAGDFKASYDPQDQAFYLDPLSRLRTEYEVRLHTGEKQKRGEALSTNGWGDTRSVYLTRQNLFEIYDRRASNSNNDSAQLRNKKSPGMRLRFKNANKKTKPHKVTAEQALRCGPYGCRQYTFRQTADSSTSLNIETAEIMFYRDAINPGTGKPAAKMPLSKAEAQANHNKLKYAYVMSPKGPQAEVKPYTGKNEKTYYKFTADIHCALVLDRNDKVLKVVPTTYGKTVYGPVTDRAPVPGSQVAAVRSTGRPLAPVARPGMAAQPAATSSPSAPTPRSSRSVTAQDLGIPKTISNDEITKLKAEVDELIQANKPKPKRGAAELGKMGFQVLNLSDIQNVLITPARTGGVRIKADVGTALTNQLNMPVGTVEYALIMFQRGNPENAAVMTGFARGEGSKESIVNLRTKRFEGVARNPEFTSTNKSDYEFAIAAIEVNLTDGKSQKFVDRNSGLLEELLVQGHR